MITCVYSVVIVSAFWLGVFVGRRDRADSKVVRAWKRERGLS